MVQKEKQVKAYTRKSKSGKQVQVKSYSAKYNSAEDMVKEALKQKKGAGKELLETKNKQKVENIPDYDFSMDDFAHWYEGDGSKQDKAVEKSLRKILGKKNYEALNDYVADNYKKGGHKLAFKKVSSFKEGATTKKASTAKSTKIPSSAVKVKTSEGDLYVSGTTLRNAKIYKETPSGIEKLHPKRGFSEKDAKKIEKAIAKNVNSKEAKGSKVAVAKPFKESKSEGSKSKSPKAPLSSAQKHAINALLNKPGWTMSKAEKYVRTLSPKEVDKLRR